AAGGLLPPGHAGVSSCAACTVRSWRDLRGPIVPLPWDAVAESTTARDARALQAHRHLGYDSVVALTAGGPHLRAHPGHRPRRSGAGVERAPRSEHRRTRRRQWLLPRVTSAPR